MFMGPLEAVKPWQTSQVQGVVRFQRRVYDLAKKVATGPEAESDTEETAKALHKCMKKVTSDVENMSFNTAISALMVLANHLSGLDAPPRKDTMVKVATMLSPFAPHLAEEVHEMMGGEGSVSKLPWVEWDESLTVEDSVTMGVQVNGKVRGQVTVGVGAEEGDVVDMAMEVEKVKRQVEGKQIVKVIYREGKILNLIVK